MYDNDCIRNIDIISNSKNSSAYRKLAYFTPMIYKSYISLSIYISYLQFDLIYQYPLQLIVRQSISILHY